MTNAFCVVGRIIGLGFFVPVLLKFSSVFSVNESLQRLKADIEILNFEEREESVLQGEKLIFFAQSV